MDNLKEQKVSDETQETNQSQNLSRGSQLLVHSPETVPCEDHPVSVASSSSSNESPEAELFLGSPIFDMSKKTKIQELVESCLDGNDLSFIDSIFKCRSPNTARSSSPGLQSVSAEHSEKEHSGDLESDLDGVPASRISTSNGSLSSRWQSLHSECSEKEQEHTDDPCVLSSPKSGILEMEDKSEILEFCLSGHDDNASDEARWESLKRTLSIGGGSPSPELESDEYSLSEKEQEQKNEYWAAASRNLHCKVPFVANSEAANCSESQLLGMIKQLRLENIVGEEFGLSDDDDDDDGVDLEHIFDSVSNSKISTPNRSASVGLQPVCSNPSDQEQEHTDDLAAAPVNDDCNFSSVDFSQAACKTAQFPHLPEKTDGIAKVESWKDLGASLEQEYQASQRTTGDYLLLADSSSPCNESALGGTLSVTTKMNKRNQQGSKITDEFSEVSKSSEFSEFSECSTRTTEFSLHKGQQSALLKKLSSILESATFQELLSVIKAYAISLQKKKDQCQKLTAKFRQAEKKNEEMNRLLKDSNYESSYLKQMIRELEVQRNVKVNKTSNDESTSQRIKLENNKLILNSRNQQNLLQELVCIQKEINEERNSYMKDLEKQLAGLREELKLPHVYCNEEKALLENIEILKEKLEDANQDLILNAMIMKDVCSYDNQMPSLKSELAAMAACLENERKSHEMLKKELESTHLCLSEAKKEADPLQSKHGLENQHLKEELNILQEESKDLSKKLAIAVSHVKDKENKMSRISKELTETNLQLEKLQWEKDQAVARSQELQTSLHQCREQLDQNRTYNEASEQQIQDLQEENNKLKTNVRKVQQELQQTFYSVSVNKGTLENTIRFQKAMEQEKDELIKKLDKLKRELDSETKRANQNKAENERLDLQLKEELLKNTEYQKKTWKLHSLRKSTKKMLQDQRIHEAEMAEVKEMVSKLQTQLTKEKARYSQLEMDSKHLEDKLDQQVMRNQRLKDELYLQRKQTEEELQTLQQQLQMEEHHLPSQSKAFEEKQVFEEMKLQHEQALQKMEKELLMLTKSYKSSCADAKRYQKLYNDETRHCMALASQLRMAQLHLQTSSYV